MIKLQGLSGEELREIARQTADTIANGESVCDYWVVGDKIRNPK